MVHMKIKIDSLGGSGGLCVAIMYFTAYIHTLQYILPDVRMEKSRSIRFKNQVVSGSNWWDRWVLHSLSLIFHNEIAFFSNQLNLVY